MFFLKILRVKSSPIGPPELLELISIISYSKHSELHSTLASFGISLSQTSNSES